LEKYNQLLFVEINVQEKDGLTAYLEAVVTQEDYQEEYDKTLEQQRKQASLPGFRKGKVPKKVIERMAGEGLKAQAVQEALQEELTKYIQNELDILFRPLPLEEDQQIDWKNQQEFRFRYLIGKHPQPDIDLSALEDLTLYRVEISAEDVDAKIDELQRRHAQFDKVDELYDAPEVRCSLLLQELDDNGEVLEEGFQKEAVVDFDNAEASIRGFLVGKERNAQYDAHLDDLGGREAVQKQFDIDELTAQDLGEHFRVTIQAGVYFKKAPLDQTLFDNVFPPDQRVTPIQSEEEFREAVADEIRKEYYDIAKQRLFLQIREQLPNKVEVPLPDEFLERYHQKEILEKKEQQEPSSDEEDPETAFFRFKENVRSAIIFNTLARRYDVEVSEDEITRFGAQNLYHNFGYTLYNLPEWSRRDYLDGILKDEQYRTQIRQSVQEYKVMEAMMDDLPYQEQVISAEELYEIEGSERALAENQSRAEEVDAGEAGGAPSGNGDEESPDSNTDASSSSSQTDS
jgi:trigger factor